MAKLQLTTFGEDRKAAAGAASLVTGPSANARDAAQGSVEFPA
jgi:hypothetical protein